jgi:hypothetical protein
MEVVMVMLSPCALLPPSHDQGRVVSVKGLHGLGSIPGRVVTKVCTCQGLGPLPPRARYFF